MTDGCWALARSVFSWLVAGPNCVIWGRGCAEETVMWACCWAGQRDSTLGRVCSGLSAIWRKVHDHSHVHCYNGVCCGICLHDRDPSARRCGPSHLALTEKIFDAWCIVGPSRGQPGAWPTGRVRSTRWAESSAWRRLSVVPGSGCVRLLVLGLSEVIRRFIHICCLRAKEHLLIDTVWTSNE